MKYNSQFYLAVLVKDLRDLLFFASEDSLYLGDFRLMAEYRVRWSEQDNVSRDGDGLEGDSSSPLIGERHCGELTGVSQHRGKACGAWWSVRPGGAATDSLSFWSFPALHMSYEQHQELSLQYLVYKRDIFEPQKYSVTFVNSFTFAGRCFYVRISCEVEVLAS